MRLWDPGARAEAKVAANAAKMEAKLAADSAVGSFVSRLSNEAATAAGGHSGGARMSGGQDVSAWVAEGLESERPAGRTARSPDPDRNGWAPGGIFGARRPDVQGRIPYERWPGETAARVEQPAAPVYEPWPGSSACQCGHC